MGTLFNELLEQQLQNTEFKQEYDALQPERAVMQAIIDARRAAGLTQRDLARRTGIAQGDISRIENGTANPSVRTLQRLAKGMGMTLMVSFVPNSTAGAGAQGLR